LSGAVTGKQSRKGECPLARFVPKGKRCCKFPYVEPDPGPTSFGQKIKQLESKKTLGLIFHMVPILLAGGRNDSWGSRK
jgi:hypothetical protein